MFDHSPISDFPGWPATTWFTSPAVASTRYCWAWSIATTAAAPSTAWRPSRWRTWNFSRAAGAFERWDTTRWGPGNLLLVDDIWWLFVEGYPNFLEILGIYLSPNHWGYPMILPRKISNEYPWNPVSKSNEYTWNLRILLDIPWFYLVEYPLVIWHNYGKSPFIVKFSMKNGDCP